MSSRPATPREAIEVMTSDVAVDVAFPTSSCRAAIGFGLAQWICRERPDIKVVLSSGVARSAKAAGELCEHGPTLAKPYEHADLERRIRALLASAPNAIEEPSRQRPTSRRTRLMKPVTGSSA